MSDEEIDGDDFMLSEDEYDPDAFDGDDGDFDPENFGSDVEEEEEEEDSKGKGKKKSKNSKEDKRIAMENQYHESKDLAEEKGIEAAIEGLSKVLEMEKELEGRNQEYSFKALKKIVKLIVKLGDRERLIKRFRELLAYNSADNGISENDLFKGIGRILDVVAATDNTELIFEIYDIALKQMKGKNENLWFKTNLKLAQRMFDKGKYAKLPGILQELEQSCMLPNGSGQEDPKKANSLLDVYGLAIQLHMEQKDRKKTKDLYERGFAVSKRNPGVLNSKLAIFHFVGGKLMMEMGDFSKAYPAFFEAFNFFEEGGSRFKIPCLKYIVLSNMLARIGINPFNSPETLNLKNHAEIKPLADLLDAYQFLDINRLESILRQHKKQIMGDPFIAQFVPNVFREIRTQVLLQLIRPYTRVTIPFLAKQLNITSEEVKELLVFLILDNKIEGKIDQVNQILLLDQAGTVAKYRHMATWTDQLGSLHNTILGRVH